MVGRSFVGLSLAASLFCASVGHAAPKAKPKVTAARPAGVKSKPAPVKPKKGKEKEKESEKESPPESEGEDKPEATSAADDAKSASKEEGVKNAGTSSKADAGAVKVKEDKADKEGVKTYKFETVEVEGRLKSPQVIYFLRRVRAEFEAGALGHRSFLGELSDSRRSAAFR